MALPLWASQVWQKQPDVQALISAKNAQDARTQQAIFAGLEAQMKQQELAAQQRQFQESMAFKQQQEQNSMQTKAWEMEMKQQELAAQQRQFQESMAFKQQQEQNSMQTKAWEMEMAQKRLAQQGLVDAANAARYEAMAAKYGRVDPPAPPIEAQPYPTMPGGAGTATMSQGNAPELTAIPADAGISAFNDANQQALGAQAGLTGLEAGISGELDKAAQEAIAPPEGPNPLLPPAIPNAKVDPGSVNDDQKYRLGLPVGQLVALGNNTYMQKLPGDQVRLGEADKKGGINFHPAQDIVPKTTQTNEDKLALLDAKTARALAGKKTTLASVLGTKPKAVQDQVSRIVSPLLNGEADFDVTKIVGAINDVERNAADATKLITDADKYGTAQQKSAVSSTLREMDLVSKAHEGRFNPLDPTMAAREQKAYDDEIKPLKEKLDVLKSTIDEKLESITGKPLSKQPAPSSSTTSTPSSNIGELRAQEGAAKNSYLNSLFKTAK